MTTKEPPLLRQNAVEMEKIYKSAVFSGIVPDQRHLDNGGYHVSLEDQPSNNYSCTRPDDKAPPGTWPRNMAAALDMSMSAADMKTWTTRWERVWADKSDPRRKYFNAVNGWKGTGEAKRYDFVSNKITTASPDHKWHGHKEWKRRYVNDPMALKASNSIDRGETKAQWLAAQPKPTPPKPSGHSPGTRDLSYTKGKALMSGDDVTFVQKWVRGTASNAIKVDGIYGPATAARVKHWQSEIRGRRGTGRVTKVDWRDMNVTVKY